MATYPFFYIHDLYVYLLCWLNMLMLHSNEIDADKK